MCCTVHFAIADTKVRVIHIQKLDAAGDHDGSARLYTKIVTKG